MAVGRKSGRMRTVLPRQKAGARRAASKSFEIPLVARRARSAQNQEPRKDHWLARNSRVHPDCARTAAKTSVVFRQGFLDRVGESKSQADHVRVSRGQAYCRLRCGGFRYLEKKPFVSSLLLGLYDNQGLLDHVGFTSSIHSEDRPALTKRLEKLIEPPGFTGKAPGGPSRWSTKHSLKWHPLAPKLVAEVQFDHFTGGRFRHGTKVLRWCVEKSPRDCTMQQVRREDRSALDLL